ncbi:hypothetical protein CEXT_13291 [Caerostris extrusa]|uniref:Uncharacterized protein n=1 Tax=Caerostris extrusa TaxID=172846 RepID=A0AAV4P7Z3_CAEEX|nr:hypothetical protein CEXT_13291 [Caerostris extrusa]
MIAAKSPSKLLTNLPTAIEPCVTYEKKPALKPSYCCEPSMYTWIHSSDGYISAIIVAVSDFNWARLIMGFEMLRGWSVFLQKSSVDQMDLSKYFSVPLSRRAPSGPMSDSNSNCSTDIGVDFFCATN